MAPQVHNYIQGTPEWFAGKLGIPSCSRLSDVIAQGQCKSRTSYMQELALERITGEREEKYQSADMRRGNVMEPKLRAEYEWEADVDVEQVGFITNDFGFGVIGFSPDGLVGEPGTLEIKSQKPSILIDTLERNRMPPAHKAQIQGGLWVAERDWCDFVAGWVLPSGDLFLRLFTERHVRDDLYIRKLADEVECFMEDLDKLENKIRNLV